VTATGVTTEWEVDRLDLDAYLARIGLEGRPPPTPKGLRWLQQAHILAIPFENVDVILGRPIRLDLDSIQDKLVTRGRGGYCYEHNLLYSAALQRLGLGVERLSARVRMGVDHVRPHSHMLMRVDAGGIEWLADAGFGGEAPIAPIPFADGAVTQDAGSWNHSLVRESESTWVLRSLHPEGWFDLYAFTLEPQHHVDYVVYNHYISTHPRSPFATRLFAQRTTLDLRLSLSGLRLVESRPDGSETVTDVDPEALADTLRERFGLPLDDEEAETLRARAQAV
jgi:N-hydroxyarylamine O-acetyltransferase